MDERNFEIANQIMMTISEIENPNDRFLLLYGIMCDVVAHSGEEADIRKNVEFIKAHIEENVKDFIEEK